MKWAFGVDPNPRNTAITITFGATLAALVLLVDSTQWWARIAATLVKTGLFIANIRPATRR